MPDVSQLKRAYITPYDFGMGNIQAGNSDVIEEAFFNSHFSQQLPPKILETAQDLKDGIFETFLKGADDMWSQVKVRLESKGYDVSRYEPGEAVI